MAVGLKKARGRVKESEGEWKRAALQNILRDAQKCADTLATSLGA